MTVSNKTTIKAFFETGDFPSQSNFSDFIDSTLFLAETSAQAIQGSISIAGSAAIAGDASVGGTFSVSGVATYGTLNATTVSTTTLNATTVNSTAVSAGSINFGGTALSVYSEGNWTPSDGSGASLVFTAASGAYTRIGRMVYAYCNLSYPSTANGNNATIAGLPFTNANQAYTGQGSLTFTQSTVAKSCTPNQNATTALFRDVNANLVTNANMSTSSNRILFVYATS